MWSGFANQACISAWIFARLCFVKAGVCVLITGEDGVRVSVARVHITILEEVHLAFDGRSSLSLLDALGSGQPEDVEDNEISRTVDDQSSNQVD